MEGGRTEGGRMEGGRRDATHAEAPVDLRRGARAGGHRWAQRKSAARVTRSRHTRRSARGLE
jgi:hypothetical protein